MSEDVFCRNCACRIFWWPESKFWSHATGPMMGLVCCFERYKPGEFDTFTGAVATPPESAQGSQKS
jgi:hypothetical protein